MNHRLTIAFFCFVAAAVVCVEIYESGFSAGEHAAIDRIPKYGQPIEVFPGERNLCERELRNRIEMLEKQLAEQRHSQIAQGN